MSPPSPPPPSPAKRPSPRPSPPSRVSAMPRPSPPPSPAAKRPKAEPVPAEPLPDAADAGKDPALLKRPSDPFPDFTVDANEGITHMWRMFEEDDDDVDSLPDIEEDSDVEELFFRELYSGPVPADGSDDDVSFEVDDEVDPTDDDVALEVIDEDEPTDDGSSDNNTTAHGSDGTVTTDDEA
ncbi:hypothetical protein ACP70R_036834 [Stipagrostis hirtigluma subsp. patula]